ncbi:flagellar protein FlaG [Vibrio maritimus]|uniref:Flagellin protein FlaG n=2 Tax=Vibrio TaxID=662 RepID=A0A090S5T9_9VIBR|nr:flagellar protein FlaG [Vibrio maritimus]GAL23075.1 flagellin protein FlaG [Vibrio maritimus]GAL30773.1 flagellin protein FlaG [Vibrio variabilis]
MDISSYASNIQPFASSNGTELASKNTNNAASQQVTTEKKEKSQSVEGVNKTETPELSNKKATEMIQRIANERQQLNDAEREKMVERLDKFLSDMNTGLSFRVDEDTGRNIVTVYAKESGDVIRQFPDEELLEVLKRIEQHGSLTIDMLV